MISAKIHAISKGNKLLNNGTHFLINIFKKSRINKIILLSEGGYIEFILLLGFFIQ